jgi:dTDP-4-amino-4,6-dideoxygalactose transaminase
MNLKIPFNRPFIVGKELYYIARAVMEGHLSGDGPYTKLCHSWLESHLGCTRAFLTHSCTGALEMAAILCDLGPGDEVIMPSFTFVSTATAVVLRGAVPVFVDIRPDTLNIDENLIEEAISDRTKAVIPVHYSGTPCAMNKIMKVAQQHNLFVIEDAAQGLLSTYRNSFLGTIGHFGCLSFHETKNVISGEGGALLINDNRFIERAEIIREKGTNRSRFYRGQVDKYTWVDIGSSFLPSELVGAFLFAQLEEAERIAVARRRILERYFSLLKPLEEEGILRLPFMDNACASNGHIFYVLTKSLEERTALIACLRDHGILSVFHYIPLHSSPAGERYGRVSGQMVITNSVSDRLLRLPMYYELSDAEIDFVAEKILEFYGGL